MLNSYYQGNTNYTNCDHMINMKKQIDTKLENFKIRFADKSDVALILNFIKELAEYEKMVDDVVATEEDIIKSLFEERHAEVIIGEYENEPVAFALFFNNFSTFVGKAGLYLEDLYVKPSMRGKGIGQILLSFLANICVERNYGRFEWSCLDWNEPSLEFYKKMGAVAMEEWVIHRVTGNNLIELAQKFSKLS